MITPLWKIETLWVQKIDGNLQDVVVTAAWRCSATEDGYVGQVFATVSFSAPSEVNFIPFDQLSQEEVLNWVWTSGVDKNAAEAAVAQSIATQKNPPIVIMPNPWGDAVVDGTTIAAPIIAPPAPDLSEPVLASDGSIINAPAA